MFPTYMTGKYPQ